MLDLLRRLPLRRRPVTGEILVYGEGDDVDHLASDLGAALLLRLGRDLGGRRQSLADKYPTAGNPFPECLPSTASDTEKKPTPGQRQGEYVLPTRRR